MVAVTVFFGTVVFLTVAKELIAGVEGAQDSKFQFCSVRPPMLAPCDLRVGSDGALWIVDFLRPIICRLDPQTCQIECYPIPYTIPPDNTSLPPLISQLVGTADFGCAMAAGYDGNLYAATGTRGQLAQANPTTREVKVVTPLKPLDNLLVFNGLTEAPDGIYFSQNTASSICFYPYNNSHVSCVTTGLVPIPLYYASDDRVYYTSNLGFSIGIFNPKTKAIEEIPIPPGGQGAGDIRAETPSNMTHPYIWFTASGENSVGRFNPNTGEFKIHPNQPGGIPSAIQVDSEQNVWFTSLTQTYLGKINSKTGRMSYVNIPSRPVSEPIVNSGVSLIYDKTRNVLWFNEVVAGTIGGYFLA